MPVCQSLLGGAGLYCKLVYIMYSVVVLVRVRVRVRMYARLCVIWEFRPQY